MGEYAILMDGPQDGRELLIGELSPIIAVKDGLHNFVLLSDFKANLDGHFYKRTFKNDKEGRRIYKHVGRN